jgi:SOS-response transcriptional repressors (RecA-mediated autopeptidases)
MRMLEHLLAILSGEFTVKRLSRRDGRVELHPANADYRIITVTEEMDFEVWGVVTGSFKSFR